MMGIAIRVKKSQDRKFKNWFLKEDLPEQSVDMHTDADAGLSMLRKLCHKLNVSEKEAFLLFELSDFSLEAIAEIQAANVNTVKTRLRRAREKLQKWLEKEYRQQDPLVNWSASTLNMEAKENG